MSLKSLDMFKVQQNFFKDQINENVETIRSLRAVLVGEQTRSTINISHGKRLCEDVINELYTDYDSTQLIPASSALKKIINALEAEVELPEFDDAEDPQVARELRRDNELMLQQVDTLTKQVKSFRKTVRKSQGRRKRLHQ